MKRAPQRRAITTALSLALLSLPVRAQVPPPQRVRLHVSRGVGAEQCPDAQRLREAVMGRLGYDPFIDPATARVELAFVRHGRWLVAELRLGPIDGAPAPPRALRTRALSCETLGASAALALSLAIEALPPAPPLTPSPPEAPAPQAVVTPPPVPVPVPVPVPAPAPVPIPVPVPASTERGWELSADALMGVNLAPSLSFGARFNAEWRFAYGRLTVGALAFAPVALREANGSVRVSAYLATAGACVGASWVAGCLVVAGGAMRGEGFDVGVPHEAVTPFFLAGIRGTIESPRFGPFRARLTAELLAPMTPTTHLIDRQAVWETPPIAATVGIGVGARIP